MFGVRGHECVPLQCCHAWLCPLARPGSRFRLSFSARRVWKASFVTIEVAAAAIVCNGRVLAARRVYPADVAGGWELPGGKVDPGESAGQAVAREIREELACEVEVAGCLAGRVEVKPGYELSVQLARLVGGAEPVPHEHDAVRWLSPEEFDDVAWLAAD